MSEGNESILGLITGFWCCIAGGNHVSVCIMPDKRERTAATARLPVNTD